MSHVPQCSHWYLLSVAKAIAQRRVGSEQCQALHSLLLAFYAHIRLEDSNPAKACWMSLISTVEPVRVLTAMYCAQNLTEFISGSILSFDTEAESSRVQERKRMRTAKAFWRGSQVAASPSTMTLQRPEQVNMVRIILMFAMALILLGSVLAPVSAIAQNLGTSPQFGQAVQGQQATTVEGTVLNIVNWGCNVIAPVIAVACLGVAGWQFKSGRGYLGWGVTGVSLMVISGLGRMAEGFITQAQGIQ